MSLSVMEPTRPKDGDGAGVQVCGLRRSRRVSTPPEYTWSCFMSELWLAGAGFGPRPTIEEIGDADGLGCTRRIGVGSRGVRERITATDWPRRLEYRVVNPSWATFPVNHHVGVVTFERLDDGGTEVRWRVEWVPKRGAGHIVKGVTRYVIWRYLDALAQACGERRGRRGAGG